MLDNFVPPPLPVTDLKKATAPAIPWIYRTGTLVAVGFVAGPVILFMLPVVWINPHLGRRAKIAWTVGILVGSALFIAATVWAVRKIVELYRMMPAL
jgi:hypothetical protein